MEHSHGLHLLMLYCSRYISIRNQTISIQQSLWIKASTMIRKHIFHSNSKSLKSLHFMTTDVITNEVNKSHKY